MATEAQFQSLIHIVYRTKQFSLLVDFKQLSDYIRRHVLISSSVLHSLFPDQRDNDTVSSLQNLKLFHTIQSHTNKFRKSFIPYSGGAKGGGAAGARAPAVKPCAPAVPRLLSYSDVDHKRISWLRAADYFEDVNYDVINHAE